MPAWLAPAADLGTARAGSAAVDVALDSARRPAALFDWARRRGLHVRWLNGERWAGVSGDVDRMGAAFGVAIHRYRAADGVAFAAAVRQPTVPAALRPTVTQVGHLVGRHTAIRPTLPQPARLADVRPGGLGPADTLAAYDATPLAQAGYTGKGDTVVLFEGGLPSQSDLDAYTGEENLQPVHLTRMGTFANPIPGWQPEATMDVEVVHSLAPDARLVAVDIAPVFATDRRAMGENLADLFTRAAARYPNAVWSLSVTWGCAADFNRADLLPAESALAAAEAKGITAFNSSGDAGGLECKEFGADWAGPPIQSDIGVDPVASLPSMTDVGGTLLSVDPAGRWVAEEAWLGPASGIGTGGGVDLNWPRPAWQRASGIDVAPDAEHRLTPDVSADADAASGMHVVLSGTDTTGGGTSQSAPIWAGLMVLIDEYLRAHGGGNAGALNPLLYQIARGATSPAFHDVTLGGNDVYRAGPGYDLATGLGTPDVANLAADLLDLQRHRS